ncbi:fructoselysine 6-kinase [Ktedonosporobacter rubrisoli]|uniref:Fructoselysine 6-kinase n=1 Tax=Ktedonosporobacter rubrisoli TaxID=2509675 RepID=A0A4P6JP72_KTERU|nr:fructoselysine 6-kinase [Ktedonosporobacter rubrisoli]QBD76993.1 fructoselysine 6-kinase [Ktedonosporobacter rubrisoli]
MKVVTVGDNCVDVYTSMQKAFPGGNAVNVAVYLQRFGLEAAYVGAVGSDAYGQLLIESLRERAVDVSHLHQLAGTTAVTSIELVNNDRLLGDYEEGVLASFTLGAEDLSFIRQFAAVHAGIWGKVEGYFPEFKAHGLITSFDFADRLEHAMVVPLLPAVDYPFFSYQQDDSYIRDYLHEAQGRGARVAVATLGEKGSLAYDGKRFYTHGSEPVKVVDTLGAGDSFIAGFLYGTLQGYTIEHCLTLGTPQPAPSLTLAPGKSICFKEPVNAIINDGYHRCRRLAS